MGPGRPTPLSRLLVACVLSSLWHAELAAQNLPSPPSAPAETAPPPTASDPPPPAADASTPSPAPAADGDAGLPAAEPEPEPNLAPVAAPSSEPSNAAADAELGAEFGAVRPAPDTSGDILVTGSRIRRSPELARSAPVEILDRRQIERSGATNTADLVAQLTAAQGSGYQGAGSPLNQGGGAVGTVLVNLRGLGPGATLVLLNGRRTVPTAGGGGLETFSDLSVVPLAAIERVEVLKGGGSAIYGADAVAGVVNIITRGAWEGVRLEADVQTTTRTDQSDLTFSGAWGARTERARLSVATSYLRRSGMLSDKREFGRVANVDQSGFPATFLAPGLLPDDPMRVRFPDPACDSVPGSQVERSIVNGRRTSDETCTFNYAKFNSLLPDLQRGNIFASASYDLTQHSSLYGEFLVNRSRSDNRTTPSYSVPPPFLTVPADHIDNPFGRAVGLLGRPFGASRGASHNPSGDDTYRVVLGLRGDLADAAPDTLLDSWEWDLSASWAIARFTGLGPDTLRARLQEALNSCSDPSDLSRCFNPFYSAIDGTGTPNSQAVTDRLVGHATNLTEHSLQVYHGSMSGLLFDLPGGEFGFALGGELRREWRTSQLDYNSNQQQYSFLLGNPDASASRQVYSAFLELRWPLYHGIELHTAGRIEHYTDIDTTTPSPFIGLTLVPADIAGKENVAPVWQRLQFTGQATWAFRAPSLYQAYPGYIVVPTALRFPNSTVPVYTPVQSFGNPDLEPERAVVLSAGFNWQPIDELVLNAEYWDYNYRDRIALESSLQAVANDARLMAMGGGDRRVIRDPVTGAVQRVEVTQRNIGGEVRTNGVDFSAILTLSGRSFGGSVQDWGALSLGLQGTLSLSYTYPRELSAGRTIPNTSPPAVRPPLHCTRTDCEAVGSRNYQTFAPPLPRWRFNFPIGWTISGHTLTVIGHLLSAVEDDNSIGRNGQLGELPAMLTVDAQYGYTIKDWIGKELALRVGVYNMFDTLPAQTRDLNGFETLLYDPRGAMVYAKASANF